LWLYIDNTVPPVAWGRVGAYLGPIGLQDTAFVDAIGTFTSGTILGADEVDVTFPDALSGKVLTGWNLDNTFTLRVTLDNVTPLPSRTTAYYDNSADPAFPRLTNGDQAIVDNVSVTARGYAVPGGIEAYWISIGLVGP